MLLCVQPKTYNWEIVHAQTLVYGLIISVALQVWRKACARAAKEMGWDKVVVVQPVQLPSSENMLAELFEVIPPKSTSNPHIVQP